MNKIRQELSELLGPDRVAQDDANRLLYSRDSMSGALLEMKAGHPPHLPRLICWPETVQEVADIVKIARRNNTPIIPYGAGSGVSGGTIPVNGGIIVDLKRMSSVEQVEERDGQFFVTVETGILGEPFEQELNRQGFTLGHFPSSILCATVGGYLACRSAGQLSSKYGKIEDMVDAIEVVLPSGKILPLDESLKELPQVRPVDLFVGSEGCLGLITRARFRVYPKPSMTRFRGISFSQLEKALQSMREMMQVGLRPSVIRLYDPLDTLLLKHGYQKSRSKKSKQSPLTKILNRFPKDSLEGSFYSFILKRPTMIQTLLKHLSSEVMLVLGFEGEDELTSVMEQSALSICRANGGRDRGERPGLHWRDHRYSVSFKMPKLFVQGCFVDTIEVATTWDKLTTLYDTMKKSLARQTLVLAHFSHAYPEGCSIYFTVVAKCESAERDLRKYSHIWHDAMESCLQAGGTISHHHGIGLLKAKFLKRELGAGMLFYRDLKRKLDPLSRMNPGKMGL